jgi:hypothetical protein
MTLSRSDWWLAGPRDPLGDRPQPGKRPSPPPGPPAGLPGQQPRVPDQLAGGGSHVSATGRVQGEHLSFDHGGPSPMAGNPVQGLAYFFLARGPGLLADPNRRRLPTDHPLPSRWTIRPGSTTRASPVEQGARESRLPDGRGAGGPRSWSSPTPGPTRLSPTRSCPLARRCPPLPPGRPPGRPPVPRWRRPQPRSRSRTRSPPPGARSCRPDRAQSPPWPGPGPGVGRGQLAPHGGTPELGGRHPPG